jgi:hypothetical protein
MILYYRATEFSRECCYYQVQVVYMQCMVVLSILEFIITMIIALRDEFVRRWFLTGCRVRCVSLLFLYKSLLSKLRSIDV